MNISAVGPDKIYLTPSYDTVHEIKKKSAISDTTSVWVQRPKHKKTTLGSISHTITKIDLYSWRQQLGLLTK